jgi:WD40 repeat protein
MFERKKGYVSIWVGQGLTKANFEKYAIHENNAVDEYGDQVGPLNDFTRDAGATWFDHDFVAAEWMRGKGKSVEAALQGFRDAEFFSAGAAKLAKSKQVSSVNSVVVMYDSILDSTRWPRRSPLMFLGNLPYLETQPKATRPALRKDDHTKPVCNLSISPDGRFGLSFGYDDVMRLWDLENGTHIAKHGLTEHFLATWMPDNQRFVTELPFRESPSGSTWGFTIWKADAASLTRQKDLKTMEPVRLAQLSPDGKRLLWANEQPMVGDIAQWKPSPLGKPGNLISSTLFLTDGRLVAIDDKGKCTVWDADLEKVMSRFALPKTQVHGQLSEHEIVVSSLVVNVHSGKVVRKLKDYLGLLTSGFAGDDQERRFAEIGSTGIIQVWKLKTGARVFKAEIDEVELTGAIAGDAGLIATVSHHANLHLWDLSQRRRTATWREAPQNRTVEREIGDGDGYELTAVAISPDGKQIMVGESSGRVFIFRRERSKLKRLR